MSGREFDPDGTDSYHPQHPWEQAGHPLYLTPGERTSLNWPPAPAYPTGPHEAGQWANLPPGAAYARRQAPHTPHTPSHPHPTKNPATRR